MLSRIQLSTGIDLAYHDSGAGPAIALVHGHPFDHTMWQPQIDFLSASHRVIVPDLRGYGQTPLPAGKPETFLDDHAADILALTQALGVDEFILAGLSQGGQIVLETWRQAPDRIRALVLADTFASLDSPQGKQLRFDTATRLEADGMSAYANEVLEKMITPANARTLPVVAEQVLHMMRNSDPTGAAASLRGRAQRRDYLPLLPEIAVPTLIIVGREDAYTPVALAEEMHSRISNSRLEIIEESGHMPNLERPETFNAILESFLSS